MLLCMTARCGEGQGGVRHGRVPPARPGDEQRARHWLYMFCEQKVICGDVTGTKVGARMATSGRVQRTGLRKAIADAE